MSDKHDGLEGRNIDDEKLEHEYSPSLWTNRFTSGEETIRYHINYVTKESNQNRILIPWKSECYGKSERQVVDIFGIDLEEGSPIVIYIHGGFWQMLSHEVSCYPALSLYKAGIRTAVIGYDLCPTVSLGTIVHQLIEAVQFVLRYAEQTEARNVIISGHSAGAHLAAMVISAVSHRLLTGAVLISGLYHLTPIISTTNWAPLGVENKQSDIDRLSPVSQSYEHCTNIKFMIVIGGHESNEFKRQSKMMVEIMQKQKLNIIYEEHGQDDHFSIVEKLSVPCNYLMKFALSFPSQESSNCDL